MRSTTAKPLPSPRTEDSSGYSVPENGRLRPGQAWNWHYTRASGSRLANSTTASRDSAASRKAEEVKSWRTGRPRTALQAPWIRSKPGTGPPGAPGWGTQGNKDLIHPAAILVSPFFHFGQTDGSLTHRKGERKREREKSLTLQIVLKRYLRGAE